MQKLMEVLPIDFIGRSPYTNTPSPPECVERGDFTCFTNLGKRYFFYLALENSDCQDYITEKVFENSYMTGMIPLVCHSIVQVSLFSS
jgi:hypothetical protein